jgi:hypothetical protein
MAKNELIEGSMAEASAEVMQQWMDEGTVGVRSIAHIRAGLVRRGAHYHRIWQEFGMPLATVEASQQLVPQSS